MIIIRLLCLDRVQRMFTQHCNTYYTLRLLFNIIKKFYIFLFRWYSCCIYIPSSAPHSHRMRDHIFHARSPSPGPPYPRKKIYPLSISRVLVTIGNYNWQTKKPLSRAFSGKLAKIHVPKLPSPFSRKWEHAYAALLGIRGRGVACLHCIWRASRFMYIFVSFRTLVIWVRNFVSVLIRNFILIAWSLGKDFAYPQLAFLVEKWRNKSKLCYTV